MNVTGNASNIDISRWKKLSAQEILKQESKGEEIPSEIVSWAEQMAALAKIPDDVTYEQVDGDVGLDALDKLGISPEDAGFAAAPKLTMHKIQQNQSNLMQSKIRLKLQIYHRKVKITTSL